MADDASYTSFLNKANASLDTDTSSTNPAQSTSASKSKFDPSSQPNSSLPSSLHPILSSSSYTYTSDTDSHWEPAFFSYSGSVAPSLSDFKKCLAHDSHKHGEVEELGEKDFDPRGEYTGVIDAVRQAGKDGKGDVKIFRVEMGSTRVEYYVLTVAEDGRKLVGVFAKAVES